MEGDEISAVVTRVSELRFKITNCIHKSATKQHPEVDDDDDDDDDDEEEPTSSPSLKDSESLFGIHDALESLEGVLASLQVMQQQQRYEREVTLAEIDHGRKILLTKIKDYKGDDLDVINEVSAFASETVEHDDDLLLPPYPSHSHPLILDKGYSSIFPSAHDLSQNGVINLEPIHKERTIPSELERTQTPNRILTKGLKHILNLAAKTLITIVGVVSILSVAGYEPRFRGRNTDLGVIDIFQKSESEDKVSIDCPPGKVLVVENGEQRCLVKERIEIPFEPVVTTPDVSYGCG